MSSEKVVYVGNLSHKVTKDLLTDMFVQVGPLSNVSLIDSGYCSYAWVEFLDEESVLFAVEMMNGIPLFGKPIRVTPKRGSRQELEYNHGAEQSGHSDNSMKRDHSGYAGHGRYANGMSGYPSPISSNSNVYNMFDPHATPSLAKSRAPTPGFKIPSSLTGNGSSNGDKKSRFSMVEMAKRTIRNALVSNERSVYPLNTDRSGSFSSSSRNDDRSDNNNLRQYEDDSYGHDSRSRSSKKY